MMEVMLGLIAPMVVLVVMFIITDALFWVAILLVEFVIGATNE